MFELDEYSSGYHDGILNKYNDLSGPALDFYTSDSLQDLLDIDIRKEIASVVGGSNEPSLVSGLPSSFDHAMDTIASSIQKSNNPSLSNSLFSSYVPPNPHPPWSDSTWSISSDYHADVGACVNPVLVMPMLTNAFITNSPKKSTSTSATPTLDSPNANETKSHLSFSPAQVKIKAGSIRHEQILSHIPKQIVSISSTVTSATTAPATLATNSALQRKNATVVETIKKDLGKELRKLDDNKIISTNGSSMMTSNGILTSNSTNTIKLAPGIGGLTFANSLSYNKLKQQVTAKATQGSHVTTANGSIIMKRDRVSSPSHMLNSNNNNNSANNNNNSNNNSQHITKILARNIVHSTNGFTPKSIASANSPLMQNISIGSPTSSVSSVASSPSTHGHHTSTTSNNGNGTSKSNQKMKLMPSDSDFPKPAYSYSCLIALALKNSRSGSLPVSEIYRFMCEHFPYFKTAPNGWKNSVRHNLSLNNSFQKIEPVTNGTQRKGCFWAMNPDCISKMDGEVQKWSRKDPLAIRNAMVYPDHLEALERGEMKHGSTGDCEVDPDSQSEIEEASDLEEQEQEQDQDHDHDQDQDQDQDQDLDDTIVDNMFVEEDIEEDDLVTGIIHNGDGSDETVNCNMSQQHQDFDIEVEDIYDTIDVEDDKETVGIPIDHADIIELSPSDINSPQHSIGSSGSTGDYPSPKRARLSINYSIGPAGELERQLQQHQIYHHGLKQIKVESFNPQQSQFQHQGHQQFVVHTVSNGNGTSTIQTLGSARPFGKAQQQQTQYIIAAKCN